MPEGHGGERRATQIWELLSSAGFDLQPFPLDTVVGSGWKFRLRRYLTGARRSLHFQPFPAVGMSNTSRGNKFLSDHRSLRLASPVLIFEDTAHYNLIPEAKAKGLAVVALPQNLESLYEAKDQAIGVSRACRNLSHEVQALRMADAVFCISREEQWLLRGLGVQAEYLPYFPPQAVMESSEKTRTARAGTSRDHFLMMGNANNGPNRVGMQALLDKLKNFSGSSGMKVVVAGFGTERLSNYSSDIVSVIGTVSELQMNDLVAHSRGLLAHQDYGFGGLTKLMEMLACGVPVIASEIAARSHFDCQGVYVYNSDNQLNTLLNSVLEEPPIQQPNRFANELFISCVARLTKSDTTSSLSITHH